MYILFILHFFVCFNNGAELHDPSPGDNSRGAAQVAKLLDFINKAFNNEKVHSVKLQDVNDGNEEHLEVIESMKLLQKNYDTGRKFNEMQDDVKTSFISNPEVLAAYKSLPDDHTDVYDDISNQDTQRSYLEEMERIGKPPIYGLKSKEESKIRKTSGVGSGADDSVKTDDTNDQRRAETHLRLSNNDKRIRLVSILKQLLEEHVRNENLDLETLRKSIPNNILEVKIDDGNIAKLFEILLELQNGNKGHDAEEKGIKNMLPDKENFLIEILKYALEPIVVLDDNIAENLLNTNRKRYKSQKDRKHKDSTKKSKKNNKNLHDFIDRAGITVNWDDYDDKYKKKYDEEFYLRDNVKSKEIKGGRKANNEDLDTKFDDIDWGKPRSRAKKETDDDVSWDKKEKTSKKDKWDKNDDSWDKKEDKWDKKEDKWDKKEDKWDKKDDKWNKKNDDSYNNDDDSPKKKKPIKSNKDDKVFQKKKIDWDTKNDKTDNWDDVKKVTKHENIKKDYSWNNVGSNKKQNSDWGSYNSYKKKDKPKTYDSPSGEYKEKKAPKFSFPTWDVKPSDDYHDRPKKKGHNLSPYRTPIPFVGKKIVYAD